MSLGVSLCSGAVSGAGSLSAAKSVDCICASGGEENRRIRASDVGGERLNAAGGRHDERDRGEIRRKSRVVWVAVPIRAKRRGKFAPNRA